MSYYLALTLLILLCFAIIHLYLHYSQKGRLVNKIPGPPVIPLLGNILDLHDTRVKINERLREWGKRYYPIYRLWFINKPLIHLRHPDDVEILLSSSKHIDKEFAYEHFYPWLQTGLLTSIGRKWHQRRKILTPAFHFNVLKKYFEIINEQAEKTVVNTRAMGKELNIPLVSYCGKATLNVICESAMGVSLDDSDDQEAAMRYKAATFEMGDLMVYRMIRPYIKDWMVPYLPYLHNRVREVVKSLNEFTNKIVKERREYHESTDYKLIKEVHEKNLEVENIYTGKKMRMAMLDLLLAAEKDGLIDDAGIKEEVSTFIFAGHDTTGMALSFIILVLAENKDAQNKAREEVERIYNESNRELQISDLSKMNYLERCIKEGLRLYPSVPIVVRHLNENLKLKNYEAPKGSDVFVHIIDTHHDPTFWPEPEKFDPDRFLPECIRQQHPFAYIPFSAGPRNCIGQKFAMIELKTMLAHILYHFDIEAIDRSSDVTIQSDVVIRTSQPFHAKFIRIDRQTSL